MSLNRETKNACMIIYGKSVDEIGLEDHFRPGTIDPGMHWAYRLLDTFAERSPGGHSIGYHPHLSIQHSEEHGIRVFVDQQLSEMDDGCFEQVMQFIRSNDLLFDFPGNAHKCKTCPGHPECLYVTE